jgi:hypothetical protein
MHHLLVFFEPGKTADLLVIVVFVAMLYALLNVVAVSFSLKDQLLLLFLDSLPFQLDHCFLVLGIASLFPNMVTKGTVSYFWHLLGNIPVMLCNLN